MTDKPDAGEAARRIVEAENDRIRAYEEAGYCAAWRQAQDYLMAVADADAATVARAYLSSSKRIEELEKESADLLALVTFYADGDDDGIRARDFLLDRARAALKATP